MDSSRARAAGGFLLSVACLFIILAGLRSASSLVLPFLTACFLAVISLPLVAFLRARRLPAGASIFATLGIEAALLVVLLGLVAGSLRGFAENVDGYGERLDEKMQGVLARLDDWGIDVSSLTSTGPAAGDEAPEDAAPDEADMPEEPAPDGAAPDREPPTAVDPGGALSPPGEGGGLVPMELLQPGSILAFARRTLQSLTGMLSNSFLVILTLMFLLGEAATIPTKLERAFGKEAESRERFDKIVQEIQSYFGMKTLLSLVTGVCIALWLWVLGVDFPILWGLVAFLLNFIPNLGSIMAAVPAILLAVVQFGPGRALAAAAGYVVVNVVIGNFVEPTLMGRRLGLSTLVVFLSLVFWGWLWGPVGMLLSVPLTMVIKIFLEHSDEMRWAAVLLGPAPRGEA